jgi:3-phenylpropionate/cinnamic acid dioxygenase small subunit
LASSPPTPDKARSYRTLLTDELERWADFFTEDCFYRITSAENYEASLPLGLIYATSRNILKDRVSALRESQHL